MPIMGLLLGSLDLAEAEECGVGYEVTQRSSAASAQKRLLSPRRAIPDDRTFLPSLLRTVAC
jgi:hypothetical protein